MTLRLTTLTAMALLAASAGAADVESGRAKSLGCQACHGSNGIGTAPDIPNLAGQKPGYITAQLTAFRSKDRKHDLMNAMAAQLSDGDIENLAAFWSSLSAAGAAHEGADPVSDIRKSRMAFPASFPKDFVMYHEELDASQEADEARLRESHRAQPPREPANRCPQARSSSSRTTTPKARFRMPRWKLARLGRRHPRDPAQRRLELRVVRRKKELRANFNYARCLACHKPEAASSYVFGLKDIAAAK